MNFRQYQGNDEPDINLIPFIDVLLVIVIFLMISTTFNRFAELKVDLPNAEANASLKRSNEIIVGLSASGQYSIDGKTLPLHSPNDLAQALLREASQKKLDDPSINVYADGATSHQNVVNIMEAARLAGYSKIIFSTKK